MCAWSRTANTAPPVISVRSCKRRYAASGPDAPPTCGSGAVVYQNGREDQSGHSHREVHGAGLVFRFEARGEAEFSGESKRVAQGFDAGGARGVGKGSGGDAYAG